MEVFLAEEYNNPLCHFGHLPQIPKAEFRGELVVLVLTAG
jgi:hypothetical protein